MSSVDVYENHCPLNRFIRELENFSYNQKYSTIVYLEDIVAKNNDALKIIGCSVYRGYTYLVAQKDVEKRRNFCNYLNLWLDEQKSIHVTVKQDVTNEQWKLIEKLWNRLKQNDDPSRHCDRQEQQNSSEIRKRIDLMVYCVNRDYFKSYCERAIQSSNNIDKTCSNFSSFTDKYYEKFYTKYDCLVKAHEPQDYRYHISNECTLYNMSKTFPVFYSHNKTILDNGNIRAAIKECTNTVEAEDSQHEQTVDGVDDLSKHSESNDDLVQSGNNNVQSEDVPPRSESDFPESPVLDLPSQTELNSIDNGTSKSIYYAGLSLSGVFFTSMVLYKYTTLGPLIRSLVSKKEKLRQTTNKHLAEQWLQRASEYMDSNSENSHYNFPYHSMQN